MEKLIENWRAITACIVAVFVLEGFFYAYAWQRGNSSCAAAVAEVSLKAEKKSRKVNDKAVAVEMKQVAASAADRQRILDELEQPHDATDNAAAAAVMQSAFNQLRALDQPAAGHK